MKIHIIGGSGTGKSYIAEKISKKYGVKHFDLDDIFWDNNVDTFSTKMPVDKRSEQLNNILKHENWIIEGVYFDWLAESFADADKIFILMISPIVFNWRIISRFLKRKFRITKSKKKGTLKELRNLLKWTNKYNRKNIPQILKFLEPHKDKIVVLKKSKDIYKYV